MKKHKRIILILGLVMVLSLAGMDLSVFATIDTENSRASMAGIKGMSVLIGDAISPELEQTGLNRETIQTAVKLKLRMAGIKVMDKKKWTKDVKHPLLFIDFLAFKLDSKIVYAFNINFCQSVALYQDPLTQATVATTWSTNHLGHKPNREMVLNDLKEEVDRFINAYLSVNPKT